MKKLDLHSNYLGYGGASHISTCISKIEKLNISWCKIRASGIKSISDVISKLPEPMKKLDLHDNDLGDDGASHISTCLSKIEELDISWCKISASGIKSISDAISKLPEPMKKLDLHHNDFGDDGASHISTCLSKIEELIIGRCKISASGIKSISDAISKLPEPNSFLKAELFKRFIDDILWLSYDEANIKNIENSSQIGFGQNRFDLRFQKIKMTMKKLDLDLNDLGDDGAFHIATCISKIEELYIGYYKISASGIKSIFDAISKLPEPKPKVDGLKWL
ncbi:unnamed protein product [Clavelina lepadiformis]|uniref:Uncharacterized protein n=1 Tax=Clavelina lepadiformis TaxID=159417 RepID=A0ABP0G9S6_CLALP